LNLRCDLSPAITIDEMIQVTAVTFTAVTTVTCWLILLFIGSCLVYLTITGDMAIMLSNVGRLISEIHKHCLGRVMHDLCLISSLNKDTIRL
jgi:hypothetical protein